VQRQQRGFVVGQAQRLLRTFALAEACALPEGCAPTLKISCALNPRDPKRGYDG